MTIPILTQSTLKEFLDYDPLTGLFSWVVSSGGAKVGTAAGCLNNAGYITIGVTRKSYLAHRLAFLFMTGKFPENYTDHINHNRSDNRWNNLRSVTRSENGRNQVLACDNTTGSIGVYRHKDHHGIYTGRWLAIINSSGKQVYLGMFANIEDAIVARSDAEIKYGYHKNHGK